MYLKGNLIDFKLHHLLKMLIGKSIDIIIYFNVSMCHIAVDFRKMLKNYILRTWILGFIFYICIM